MRNKLGPLLYALVALLACAPAIVAPFMHTLQKKCSRAAAALALAAAPLARADIYRWDDATIIPGTESITPAPGIDLSHWNTPGHTLQYADFTPYPSLSAADFSHSDLSSSLFISASLHTPMVSGCIRSPM